MKLKVLFLTVAFVSLIFASCSTVPKKTINTDSSYSWTKERFELDPQNQSFSAEGEVTMWIDSVQFKGKFNGDYQILSSERSKWRMIITGPFNISVATVIINGMAAHIFHDGKWESKPWPEISAGLFNADVDGDVLSVILGGRFKFDGECAEISENSKLCKMNEIYYKFAGNQIVEILSGDLYAIRKDGSWTGVRNGKYAFIFKNKDFDNTVLLKDSLFGLPVEEKDEFDDL